MIRIIEKLFAITVVLGVCSAGQPSFAENVAFMSATGGGSACTQTAPCASIYDAMVSLGNTGGRVVCMTPGLAGGIGFNESYVFDCPLTVWNVFTQLSGSNVVLKFEHTRFNTTLKVVGGGTMILDDCTLEDVNGIALDIEPTGPFNLIVNNSRISNNSSGVLIEPASGGSVKARFDRVTISQNSGGGIKVQTTNGPVTVDITDSSVSDNAGNGINAVAGAGQNIVSIKNSVIAGNGVAGVQANGVNAGVLIATTLLDQNVAGATSVVSGGNMFTYGNNDIVGSIGSGFTGTATLR
jgi:hypothetical protein